MEEGMEIKGNLRIDLPNGKNLYYKYLRIIQNDNDQLVFIDDRKNKRIFTSDVVGFVLENS